MLLICLVHSAMCAKLINGFMTVELGRALFACADL